MPDKKRKFETKVHRKTLNPFFNETFAFKNVSESLVRNQIKLKLSYFIHCYAIPSQELKSDTMLILGALQRNLR